MKIRSKKKLLVLAAIAVFTILAVGYAYFIEPSRLVVNNYELKITNWNPVFNNFKIAAISDIHAGSNNVTEEKIRQIVQVTNEQNPDLIVLLGDYVSPKSGDRSQIKMNAAVIAENLRGFQAKYGVYAVLGNHDGWHDGKYIALELTRAGIRVLQNEIVFIEKDGQKLRILGLKDHMQIITWAGFVNDIRTVIQSEEQTGGLIVLQHSPDVLPLITEGAPNPSDLKLILNGHTHGGQISFPILGPPMVPSVYGQRFAAGHTKENNVDIFVTTGIGTSIFPFRFLVPPEIAVLTINAK